MNFHPHSEIITCKCWPSYSKFFFHLSSHMEQGSSVATKFFFHICSYQTLPSGRESIRMDSAVFVHISLFFLGGSLHNPQISHTWEGLSSNISQRESCEESKVSSHPGNTHTSRMVFSLGCKSAVSKPLPPFPVP